MSTLYQLESTWVNFAIYINSSTLFLVLRHQLYCYFDIRDIIFDDFLAQYSRGSYLNKHKSTVFSNFEHIYELNKEKIYILVQILPEIGLIEAKKQYLNTFVFIEDCINTEISSYKYVNRGNLS